MHSFEAYNSVTCFCKNENRSRAAQTLVLKIQLRFFFYFAENQIVYAITERHFEKKNSKPAWKWDFLEKITIFLKQSLKIALISLIGINLKLSLCYCVELVHTNS